MHAPCASDLPQFSGASRLHYFREREEAGHLQPTRVVRIRANDKCESSGPRVKLFRELPFSGGNPLFS